MSIADPQGLFADIAGQERAVEYLGSALASGATTHAYLLSGADDETLRGLATRFAAGLIADAPQGAAVQEVLRGTHPDLHVMAPAASTGYLIGQVRELVHDAELAPIRSERKVYVVQQANRLSGASANAFLKTLEEPPADVVCILLAPNADGVLETLRSRCEVVRCASTLAARERDDAVFDALRAVADGAGPRELFAHAARIVERSADGLDALQQRQEAEEEASADYLSQGALKELAEQHKRERTAHQREGLLRMLAAARGWLRDCMLVAEGMPGLVEHADQEPVTGRVAATAKLAQIMAAVAAVDSAQRRISYNVTPQLAIEAMLVEIEESLCPK